MKKKIKKSIFILIKFKYEKCVIVIRNRRTKYKLGTDQNRLVTKS